MMLPIVEEPVEGGVAEGGSSTVAGRCHLSMGGMGS